MKKIQAAMTVRELLTHYPGTIAVFIRYRMLCIGCPTAGFHTVTEVARLHGLDVANLLETLRSAAAANDPDDGALLSEP